MENGLGLGVGDKMTDFKVKYNKDTSWTVQSKDKKIFKKIWNKKELEDFFDYHENLSKKNIFSKLFKFTR